MFTEPKHTHKSTPLIIRPSVEKRDDVKLEVVTHDDVPMIEILFKLPQEVPSFLHLRVTIGIIGRGDALRR